jgi:hypothetical protein
MMTLFLGYLPGIYRRIREYLHLETLQSFKRPDPTLIHFAKFAPFIIIYNKILN